MENKSNFLPEISEKRTYIFLRVVISLIFITHGLARIYYWSIPDFGTFLNSQGLIIGKYLAWVITLGEIVSGIFVLIGYKVRFAVLFNFVVIVSGIFLVHLKNGWFVVGHGQGGVEYSLLIVAVLIFIYSQGSKISN